jgi:hypothetical protein
MRKEERIKMRGKCRKRREEKSSGENPRKIRTESEEEGWGRKKK